MDLTRLYNLTTPELREEAERLGVDDTYAMSRGQLIHAIRNRSSGQESEGFLGKVLGFAKWAIQAAQEEPRKEAVSWPARRETEARGTASEAPEQDEAKRFGRPGEAPLPSADRGSVSAAVPAAVSESVPEPEPVSVPASVPGSVSASVSASVPVSTPVPASASMPASTAESQPEPEPEPEAESDSGPPSRPPVGVFSKTTSMFEEPFPTLTMARILADQGHFKRSLAIYATLLREEPGNEELSAEADGIRAQSRARRSQVH